MKTEEEEGKNKKESVKQFLHFAGLCHRTLCVYVCVSMYFCVCAQLSLSLNIRVVKKKFPFH